MANTRKARQFTAPTDKQALIEWAMRKKEAGRAVMSEQQMKMNLAFFLGYQYLAWEPRSKQFIVPPVDPSDKEATVRLTANKLAPLAERSVAKLTKDAPEPECRPVSDNDNDVDAARVGTRTLDSELTRLHWKTWLQKFYFWPIILGYSYAHLYWNPDAGEYAGQLYSDKGVPQDVYEGQTEMEIVPAYELSVDPGGKDDMTGAKWAVRSTVMTVDSAWEKWGVELVGGAKRSLAQEVLSYGMNGINLNATQSDDWVEINQLWMLPSRAAPKGIVLTWSGTTVIEKLDFPFDHGELPFVQGNALPGVGTREGRTWFTDLLGQQTDYNDALSREATIRRQIAPFLTYEAGSIDPSKIDARVRLVPFRPTGQPPKLELPNAGWAQQFEMGMQRDEKDMGERAGINDASAGQAASSAPAAAILALQEADDTKLAVTATEMADFIARIGKQILGLARQYWDDARTVRTWSDENIIAAFRYKGSDIERNLDVHVSSESALPKSKAARTQLVMELQARMPDIMDPQTMIRMLDMPGTDFLVRSMDIDARRQARENSQMLQGQEPVVQPFDNHAVHLKSLNDFRKSTDYEHLDMQGRAIFDAHAAVHEMLLLKQLGLAAPNTPEPQGSPEALAQADRASAGPAGGHPPQGSPFNAPMYTDPATGRPPSGLAVASGQAPSPLANSAIAKRAGIGHAAGQPGRVPGVPADNQAASMGG